MRTTSIAMGMAVLAMLLVFTTHSQGASISNTNITAAINSTESYINTVNQSGYLVFYPDLTSAYGYLSQAKNQSKYNPTYAYILLAKARASAQSQETLIDQYKMDSLYVLVALAFVMAVCIYLLMKPYSKSKTRQKRRK